jgi:hypothetical protein
MTFDEGKTLVKDCIAELKKRFIVGPENYKIKLINHVRRVIKGLKS